MRTLLCIALGVGALIGPGRAAADVSRQPSQTSAEDNVAYAVSAICLPFIADHVAETALPLRARLVGSDGFKMPAVDQHGGKVVRVGGAGFVHVGIVALGESRDCEVSAYLGDPQSLRRATLAALDRSPLMFTPAKSRYLPGRFETEDLLCSAADSARPAAFVFLSSPFATEQVKLLLTISDGGRRNESCDRDDVKLNYRTLIPPAKGADVGPQ